MNPLIYKITSPSNKIYIGQTWNWVVRRSIYKNLKCKGQILLYNSLVKYGYDNHIVEILETLSETVSQEELDNREIYWWQYYKNLEFKMLNLKEPGRGGKHSEETRKKMSDHNNFKGKTIPEELRQALIKSNIGRKKSKEEIEKIQKGRIGFTLSSDSREKIRQTLMKLPQNNRTVLMLDINGVFIREFKNVLQIQKELNCDTKYIREVLNGRGNTARGYKWKYKKEKL